MRMKMKNIDLSSCGSPASTAICSSMEQRSMIKTSTKSIHHRLNSYKSLTNSFSPSTAPCISELPFTPRPSSFSAYRDKTRNLASTSISISNSGVSHSDVIMTTRRRSSADIADLKRQTTTSSSSSSSKHKYTYHPDDTCHSSRYLLGESTYLDSLSVSGNENKKTYKYTTPSTPIPVFGSEAARNSTSRVFGTMLDAEKEKIRRHFSLIEVGDDHKNGVTQSPRSMANSCCTNHSLLHKPPSGDQVVVLRVSLHCKGCENKLRKHLSKLPGVTSYNIDMETKKVTVRGNVTPLEMLTSISKVKNAQFWPSQVSSSSASTSISSSSSSNSSTKDVN